MTGPTPKALVAIATRQRPGLLAATLASLAELDPCPYRVEVMVIDNDPAGSARQVAASSTLTVTYTHIDRVGIGIARNVALDAAGDDDLVAFIDDDSVADPRWLAELVTTMTHYDADVVGGPSIAVLPPNAPRWASGNDLFRPVSLPTGTERLTMASGNVVLRMAAVRRTGMRFSEKRPLLGGTDETFFRSLSRSGCRLVWTESARVFETVPPERLRLRWVWRRSFRITYATRWRSDQLPHSPAALLRDLVSISRRLLATSWHTVAAVPQGPTAVVNCSLRIARALGELGAVLRIPWKGDYQHVDGSAAA